MRARAGQVSANPAALCAVNVPTLSCRECIWRKFGFEFVRKLDPVFERRSGRLGLRAPVVLPTLSPSILEGVETMGVSSAIFAILCRWWSRSRVSVYKSNTKL